MNRIKIVFVVFATLFSFTHTKAQCPPNNSLGNVIVNPNLAVYCPGMSISGSFQKANGGWPYIGNVSWTYNGNTTIVTNGPNNSNFLLNNLGNIGGTILVVCTLQVAGQQCIYNGNRQIVMSTIQANAGPNQIYITNNGPITIGVPVCCTNPAGSVNMSWIPTTGIVGASNICQPQVNSLSSTTTYDLTVNDGYCSAQSQMTVYVGNESYAELKKTLDGGYYKISASNTLFFKYDAEYNTGNLTYKIYNDQNTLVCNSCTTLPKSYGDNRYAISLASAGVSTAGFYYLEVTNEKKEVYKLKFKL